MSDEKFFGVVIAIWVIIALLCFSCWAGVRNYNECREHFSQFYCLTRGG